MTDLASHTSYNTLHTPIVYIYTHTNSNVYTHFHTCSQTHSLMETIYTHKYDPHLCTDTVSKTRAACLHTDTAVNLNYPRHVSLLPLSSHSSLAPLPLAYLGARHYLLLVCVAERDRRCEDYSQTSAGHIHLCHTCHRKDFPPVAVSLLAR